MRYWKDPKDDLKNVFYFIYGLSALLFVPWYLGAIYRHEQSVWIVNEINTDINRFGLHFLDIFIIIYSYLIFYSFFVVLPWLLFAMIEQSHEKIKFNLKIKLLGVLFFLLTFFLIFFVKNGLLAITLIGWLILAKYFYDIFSKK